MTPSSSRSHNRRPPCGVAFVSNGWFTVLVVVAATMLLAAWSCAPATEATGTTDNQQDRSQIVIEAFIVEAQQSVFDTRYAAIAAAARGQAADLVPGGDGATLAERLAAAERSGALTILAAPSFVVRSGDKASVQSGLQIPVQTVNNETVTVQFVNATLRLEVAPRALAGDQIEVQLNAQKRFPDSRVKLEGPPSAPIQTTEVSTSTIVADGGTAVVGGVFETRGAAEDQVRGKELVVLVTPRVLDL